MTYFRNGWKDKIFRKKIPESERKRGFCLYSWYGFKGYYENDYITPCAFIASATFRKPAMFAPATKLPSQPYSLAALAMLW